MLAQLVVNLFIRMAVCRRQVVLSGEPVCHGTTAKTAMLRIRATTIHAMRITFPRPPFLYKKLCGKKWVVLVRNLHRRIMKIPILLSKFEMPDIERYIVRLRKLYTSKVKAMVPVPSRVLKSIKRSIALLSVKNGLWNTKPTVTKV